MELKLSLQQILQTSMTERRLPRWLSGKESACSAGDAGLIPELRRSPGEVNGSPLQYTCLGNPWTEEPGGLQSMGSQRIGHDLVVKPPPPPPPNLRYTCCSLAFRLEEEQISLFLKGREHDSQALLWLR